MSLSSCLCETSPQTGCGKLQRIDTPEIPTTSVRTGLGMTFSFN